jgi:YVTN family beta-propeller protein
MQQSRRQRQENEVGCTDGLGRWVLRPAASLCSLVLAFALLGINADPASAQVCAYFAYIPNAIDHTVSVIDTRNNSVIATIPVGAEALGVAIHPNGTFVYVTNQFDDTVSVIDTASLTVVATIPVGQMPTGVAVHPTGTFVYVTNAGDQTLSAILTSNNTVYDTLTVQGFPWGVAVSGNGQHIYVANAGSDTVSVIDAQSFTVADTVSVGDFPDSIAVDPQGDLIYVGNHLENTVSVIQRPGHNVIFTIPVGSHPHDIEIHPQSTFLYVANDLDHTVSVFEHGTWVLKATVPIINAQALTAHPEGDRVYVTGATTAMVSVIDVATNTVVDTVPVGTRPEGLGDFIVCDRDVDNDGCNNDVDQHRDSAIARSGSIVPGPGCPRGVAQDTFAYEGSPVDTDGDGVLNCADFDDDDDGLCDDDETLPATAPGVPDGGCFGPDPCPLHKDNNSPACLQLIICLEEEIPWWLDCRFSGTGCFEFFVKIESLINPDPTARFDTIEIVGQTLYVTVGAHMSVPDAVNLLLGESAPTSGETALSAAAGDGSRSRNKESLRLELWQTDAAGAERFVALIAEYQVRRVKFGTLDGGRVLAIEPIAPRKPTSPQGTSLWVNAVRAPGAPPVCELRP